MCVHDISAVHNFKQIIDQVTCKNSNLFNCFVCEYLSLLSCLGKVLSNEISNLFSLADTLVQCDVRRQEHGLLSERSCRLQISLVSNSQQFYVAPMLNIWAVTWKCREHLQPKTRSSDLPEVPHPFNGLSASNYHLSSSSWSLYCFISLCNNALHSSLW